jgi:hypothetical protein
MVEGDSRMTVGNPNDLSAEGFRIRNPDDHRAELKSAAVELCPQSRLRHVLHQTE